MAKTLKKLQGKGKSFEVKTQSLKGTKTFECLDTLKGIENTIKNNKTELEKVYDTLYYKVSNGYKAIEKEHGQFEFDKFDVLHEAFAIVQDYVNQGMKFENLEHYTKKVFNNTLKNYHRKFVKPVNSDTCFIEFNTDKLTLIDENSPSTGYIDQSSIDRKHFVKTIIKALKKNDKKLFALYHCKEYSQIDLQKKLALSQQAVSIKIKRLNYKIINICKKYKIDTLLNKAFAMPSWKHESLKGKWQAKHNTKPSISNDTRLESQSRQGLRHESPIDYSNIGNSFCIKSKLPMEIPMKNKPFNEIQKGKRAIIQNGFFANTVNQSRLLNLLDTVKDNNNFSIIEKSRYHSLFFGSDTFRAFYSKKSLFDEREKETEKKPVIKKQKRKIVNGMAIYN